MSDAYSDEIDSRRAAGIVNALKTEESCRCKCGAEIGVSDCHTSGEVVERLEEHRSVCSGNDESEEDQ